MAALIPGSTYTLTVTATGAFPSGVALAGSVKTRLSRAERALLTLTTANGRLTRVSNDQLRIDIPGTATAKVTASTLFLDIWDVSASEPRHLGFRIEIPVAEPVTERPA